RQRALPQTESLPSFQYILLRFCVFSSDRTVDFDHKACQICHLSFKKDRFPDNVPRRQALPALR
ncbi:MAG TPA: hypothetical protein VGN34_34630, partial [Ktedonobacteraceae bacterium]